MSFTVTEWFHTAGPARGNEIDAVGPPDREATVAQGERALAAGQLLEAERSFHWLLGQCDREADGIRCRALAGAGHVARLRGNRGHARILLAEALTLARRLQLKSQLSRIAHDLGLLYLGEGDQGQAEALFRLAVAGGPGGDHYGCSLLEIARIRAEDRDWAEVERACVQAAPTLLSRRQYEELVSIHGILGRSFRERGDWPAACRSLQRGLRLAENNYLFKQAAELALQLAEVWERLQRPRRARRMYETAVQAARRASWDTLRARALLGLGRLAISWRGDARVAYEHLWEARTLLCRTTERQRLEQCLRYLVSVCLCLGLDAQARDCEQQLSRFDLQQDRVWPGKLAVS